MRRVTARHFLDLDQVEAHELRGILDRAAAFKGGDPARPMAGRTLAMIFDKPSTRTRVSFEVAANQLGGDAIVLIAARHAARARRDGGRHGARALALRRRDHDPHRRATRSCSSWPSTPRCRSSTASPTSSHPCQIVADVMTIEEQRGPIARQDAGLGRRRQQRADLAGPRRGRAWTSRSTSRARRSWRRAPELLAWARRAAGRGSAAPAIPREAVTRRRRGVRRHLGVDGPAGPGAPPPPARALPGRRTRLMRHAPARGHLPALPAGAPRRGGDGRGHRRAAARWSSTRPRTGCTRRRRSSSGASAGVSADMTTPTAGADLLRPFQLERSQLRGRARPARRDGRLRAARARLSARRLRAAGRAAGAGRGAGGRAQVRRPVQPADPRRRAGAPAGGRLHQRRRRCAATPATTPSGWRPARRAARRRCWATGSWR